jgi:hypothetical protein
MTSSHLNTGTRPTPKTSRARTHIWAVRGAIPVRSRNSSLLKNNTWPGAHPASYSMSTVGFFSRRYSGQDVQVTTHFHLVPKLRMSGVVLPIYAFTDRRGTKSKVPLLLTGSQSVSVSSPWSRTQLLRCKPDPPDTRFPYISPATAVLGLSLGLHYDHILI